MDIVPATVGLVFTTKRIGCFVLFPGYCGWVPFFPRKKGFSSHAMQGARIFGMGTRYGLEVPFLLYLSTVCLFEHQAIFLELSNASRVAECDIRKSRGIGPYC